MPADLGDKYHHCQIVQRRDFSDDLWSIRLRPETPFAFRPGQYATLGVELSGKVLERPYSIVSAPEEPELEFFLEKIPGGALTPHLHPLGEGSTLLMRKRAKGLFLRAGLDPDRAHLFLATVTGIAPFASILRHLLLAERPDTAPRRILLLQGASFSSEFGYSEEMAALAAAHSWFDYVPTISRPWGDPEWKGETGRAEDVLRKYADRWGVSPGAGMVYLCGHPGMIATARAVMTRSGLADSEILEEQYWPEGKEPTGEL
ncbi:MAG TPA: FAD-binding oxidoreductase [Candidatus Dormibacteraeota bacterium]|nr:FAD-binding oxidoreductase [Candidatus Dormibacteraeota bacterium]